MHAHTSSLIPFTVVENPHDVTAGLLIAENEIKIRDVLDKCVDCILLALFSE